MGRVRASLCLVAVLTIGGALETRATEPTADTTRIGRYRVERSGTSIAIARTRDRSLGLLLLAGGLALAGIGQAVRGSGRTGSGTALLLVGMGIAAVGGTAALGAERWRADETGLVRERLGGRVDRWPRAGIAGVEIARRAASAEDFKRARIRPWDVTVRGRDAGRIPLRFSVESDADARELASLLGAALAVEVREPR